MIHEYAVEPELMLDADTAMFLASNFGISRARLVSEFPEHWDSLVHAALADSSPVAKHQIVEALSRLKRRMMPRCHDWDFSRDIPWLEQAEHEHGTRPFHAIVASDNPRSVKQVLRRTDLHEGTKLWNVETQGVVARTADAMAACAATLLRCAREVYFVDPHFCPGTPRFRRPFEEFMKLLGSRDNRVPLGSIELHTWAKAPPDFIRTECNGRIRNCIPTGMTVRLIRWEKDQRFHNRYILTDRGGISFGQGLDDGDGVVSNDDVALLSEATHRERRDQFRKATSPFKPVDEFLVLGRP